MSDLRDLQELVTRLNSTNSSSEKMEILSHHPECKPLLLWVYNDFVQFYVTSVNLKKNKDLCAPGVTQSITDLLVALSSRRITGHDAIAAANGFVQANEQHSDLIYDILDKDLKVRMGTSSVNKVFKDLVPVFDVALGKDYFKTVEKKPIDFEKEVWFASRKLDGLRVLDMVDVNDGESDFRSRTGKVFETLGLVADSVRGLLPKLGTEGLVFDGEGCVIGSDGVEDFKEAMSQIRKKAPYAVNKPIYFLFDLLTRDEFDKGKSKRKLSERLRNLRDLIPIDHPVLKVVPQVRVNSQEHLDKLLEDALLKGWEGLILRKDVPYKSKRSSELLKVKKFYDAEYVVESIETGDLRIVVDDPGSECGTGKKEITVQGMTRANIRHKGNIVGVGSGWSIPQRQEFEADPSLIVGKTITVQYFEESEDDKGNPSLRFPVVKCVHGDKRDT